jgi:hypothetical protein
MGERSCRRLYLIKLIIPFNRKLSVQTLLNATYSQTTDTTHSFVMEYNFGGLLQTSCRIGRVWKDPAEHITLSCTL